MWYFSLAAERESSIWMFSSVKPLKPEVVKESRNTVSLPRTPVGGTNLKLSHMLSLISNASRRLNNFKNARTFQSKAHTSSLNSRTVFPRDPKHASRFARKKAMNETETELRVRDLTLTNAEKWAQDRRSSCSKPPDKT